MVCERKDNALLREGLHHLLPCAERYLNLNQDSFKQKWKPYHIYSGSKSDARARWKCITAGFSVVRCLGRC